MDNKKFLDVREQKYFWHLPKFKLGLNLPFDSAAKTSFINVQAKTAQAIEEAMAPVVKAMAKLTEQIKESEKDLPDRWRQAVLVLANEGWYQDMNSSPGDAMRFAELLDQGKHEEVNKSLAEYFSGRLEDIEESLIESFPKRSALFAEAFTAHRNRMFACSITLLLTQVDGICVDLANGHFFMRSKKKLQTKTFVDSKVDSWIHPLLVVLEEPTAVNLNSSERQNYGFTGLNRHSVLHGAEIDYATEINSLRVISLLSYLETFMWRLRPLVQEGSA